MEYHISNKVAGLKASAIREILKFATDPSVISFAAGNPAPEAFPVEDIRRITAELLSENPILALQYSLTEGYTPLRDTMKAWMSKEGNFHEDIDDLIIVSGAQQGIELSAKVLCDEGDTILCEAPSFVGSLNSFKSYSVHLEGVEMDDDGINLEKLEDALKKNPSTRVLYLIPNFQNPTGRTTSLAKRKAVLELAKRYDFIILEDNPYGYLRFSGEDVPTIKSMDTEGRVIYCGSFSKILAPGLRVGYISAPKTIVQKIVVAKQAADVHTNIMAQVICKGFLDAVPIEGHLDSLRKIYARKAGLMLKGVKEHFSSAITCTQPEGGLFLWLTLPEDSDMPAFCSRAVQEYKVAVVPGNAFMINESDRTTSFRMNFSTPTDTQIQEGVAMLGRMTKEMFGN